MPILMSAAAPIATKTIAITPKITGVVNVFSQAPMLATQIEELVHRNRDCWALNCVLVMVMMMMRLAQFTPLRFDGGWVDYPIFISEPGARRIFAGCNFTSVAYQLTLLSPLTFRVSWLLPQDALDWQLIRPCNLLENWDPINPLEWVSASNMHCGGWQSHETD